MHKKLSRIHSMLSVVFFLLLTSALCKTQQQAETNSSLPLRILMNARTNFSTAECYIKAGFQLVLVFGRLVNTTRPIQRVECHTKNLNTGTEMTWRLRDKSQGDQESVSFHNERKNFEFSMFHLQVPNVLFEDGSNIPVNYSLWAETSDSTPSVVADFGRPFVLAKHVFGCRPKTPLGRKIGIKDIEMESINVEWKIHALIWKFQPHFELIFDDKIIHKISAEKCEKRKCGIRIKTDTCLPHTVCIRTRFGLDFTKNLPNNTDFVCTNLKAKANPNCRRQETGNNGLSRIWIFLIVIITIAIVAIPTVFLIGRFIKSKRKRKEKEEHDKLVEDHETITPRTLDHLYWEIKPIANNPPPMENGAQSKSKQRGGE